MAEVTVKQLAQVVGISSDKLLVQLTEAGIAKTGESDLISDSEKMSLLTHMREARGSSAAASATGSKRISLKRKRVSELKADPSGRKRVAVEVRSRRTYVRPNEADTAEADTATAVAEKPVETSTPVISGAARPTADIVAEAEAEAAAEEQLAMGDADEAGEALETAIEVAAEVDSDADAAVADVPVADEDGETAVDATATAGVEAQVAAEAAAADAVAAEVERAAAAAAVPAEPEKELTPAEMAAQAAADEKRLEVERQAFAQAEKMAERQVLQTKRKEADENSKREQERREQERLAAEAQRRAAMEAQQAASSTDRGAGRGADKARGRGRGKPGGGGGGGDTRYGRNQLHVAKGKSGRRKGKPRRALPANFEAKHGFERPTAPVVREVDVPETITVAELANKMAVKAAEVIKAMMGMGVMATINQLLDQDTAILVVEEMGHKANSMSADDVEAALAALVAGDRDGDTEPRPPVVTVMGHVDHGKTSLLDYIRTSRVASGEAGGITQHIGAYQTETDNGVITFLDTPGHAAFTSMRARGAQATDIVVLVVAADDGVMPQTIEGIQHARAADVPLIIAVNKMDKEEADPERVRNELSQHEVISEDWGGDTQFIPVSAITGDGVDKLLDAITLQAEVLELVAVPEGNGTGVVIEAMLDKGRGPVATILVQEGTLKKGDSFICGQVTGRVRAMFDEDGRAVEEAGPSSPVQVLGLSATPNAGDEMLVAADEKSARELAELRHGRQRDARLAERRPQRLDDVFGNLKGGPTPTVNFVIKADVKGSYEAIRDSLEKLSTEEVEVRIMGGGVGGITESDANLALASDAILVGFNVRADSAARRLIQEQEIDLRYYSVIYELIDLARDLAGGKLAPEVRERIIGTADVREVFTSPRFGLIAGCMVVDGVVRKDEPIRVLRENTVIYEGELESLRRFKDDVKDVRMGTECGIGVKNYTDVKPGDQIEVFERTEVARTL